MCEPFSTNAPESVTKFLHNLSIEHETLYCRIFFNAVRMISRKQSAKEVEIVQIAEDELMRSHKKEKKKKR